jgi:hypothetical protein
MTDERGDRSHLDGQVVVVTGGNGGIGLGMAEGVALAGASVAIWARDERKCDDAARQLRALVPGCDVLTRQCDVAAPDQVEAALDHTLEKLGRLDALVANAGVAGVRPFLDLTLDEWRRVLAVNLDGVFITLQAAARHMVEQGEGGALVAVSSTSAFHGAPVNAHYAASKAGALALVRSMAVALARHQIRVNALVPGWARTEMMRPNEANERFVEATVARTPMRRWGEPADFRRIAAYLCDKTQLFHTGDSVVVDGGYTVF